MKHLLSSVRKYKLFKCFKCSKFISPILNQFSVSRGLCFQTKTSEKTIRKQLLALKGRGSVERNVSTLASNADNFVVKNRSVLRMVWKDKSECFFPYIYLRDNCQCENCFEGSAKQRLLDTAFTVDLNIQASEVEFDHSTQAVTITWKDGHRSIFDASWLKERQFPNTKEEQLKTSCSFVPKKVHWDGSLDIPTADFNSILNDDLSRYNWLLHLAETGLTLIKNAPSQPDELLKIPPKVGGFIRKTHYGSVFKVKSKLNPSNLAYSTRETPSHVDLAYYRYQPGTQFLHCIEQTQDKDGGGNYFVDGYHIAEQIRKEHPEAFDTLTRVRLTFRDIGRDEYGEFEKKLERPIIGCDENGNYQNIAHNNFARSSFINAPIEDVEKLYSAYYIWTKVVYADENQVHHKMEPGDIVAFDNIRILHGRKKFDPSISSRYLEGLYIDWDEVYSALRVLRRRLGFIHNDSNSWY